MVRVTDWGPSASPCEACSVPLSSAATAKPQLGDQSELLPEQHGVGACTGGTVSGYRVLLEDRQVRIGACWRQ